MSDPKQQHDTSNEAPGFFDKERNVTIILRVFYALCALLVILDFVVHRHIYTDFEKIPAFYAIYGFVACVVLVVIAKEMRKFLMRDEDYYEPTEAEVPEAKEGDN
ncbi:hypothetical protein [Aliiglaciecola litoralis]|uniref:Uncharacterized protein n=1 Tax=Aliiglaciecola litoralis TaxID=582857 RepID=A0ABN1LN75_9ALTE